MVFFIIGDGDRKLIKELEDKIQTETNIIFTGMVPEPELIYGALDLLLLTSTNEGTPVTILEAFAAHVPVLSTRAGGVVDLIGENEERGLLVEMNPSDICNKIDHGLALADSEKVRDARALVEKQFSVDALAANIDSAYSELLENTSD